MTEQEIRAELHRILDAHDETIQAVRAARKAMDDASKAQDDVIVSALEANRAAIRLLNRIQDEGVTHDE